MRIPCNLKLVWLLFFILAGAETPKKGVRVGNIASPRRSKTVLAKEGLQRSPQVKLKSRNLLQLPANSFATEKNDNPCTLKEDEIAVMLDEKTRTWKVDMATLKAVSDDLNAIIRCTQKGDMVLLSDVDKIRLPKTVTIPWKLTLSAFIDKVSVGDAILPVAERKTTFECPPKSGALQVRAKNVVLANLAFENCALLGGHRSIVEVKDCSSRNTQSVIKLHHVAFEYNTLKGARGLSIISPPCHSVEMVDVSFSNNSCGDACFAHLAQKNNLQDVTVHHNRVSTGRFHSLIFAPSKSSTSIDGMTAHENELTVFRTVKGQLNLSNAIFEGNSRHSVLVLEEATKAVVTDSLFRGNSAIMSGAGILANGMKRLEMSNCSFLLNKAENGAGVASTESNVSIHDCRFHHNIAAGEAGAVLIANGSLDLKSAHFENNTASRQGGALYLDACDLSQIFAVQCHENTAGDNGGCLWASASRELSVQNSFFRSNSAGNGGAFCFADVSNGWIRNSTVTLNTAQKKGGGVLFSGSTNIEFHNSVVMNNTAEDGGGLGCEKTRNLTIRRSSFESNVAELNGAGAWISAESSVFMKKTDWTLNRAKLRGGGITVSKSNVSSRGSTYSNNSAAYGAALRFSEGTMIVLEHDAILNNKAWVLAGGILAQFTTIAMRSCQIAQNRSPSMAGLYLSNTVATIKNTTVDENLAYSGNGAGLYSQYSNLTLKDSRFKLNHANQAGGAIAIVYSERVTARNITVRDNKSGVCAAGISITRESRFHIYDSIFVNNTTPLFGALDIANSDARVIDCSFRQNNAKKGAAVGLRGGKLFLENSTMMSNHASEEGGGIYGVGGELNATNVVFSDNTAQLYGGSLSGTESSIFVVSNCSFLNNQADRGGGFRMQPNSSISVLESKIENNTAIHEGGGGYLEDSTMVVEMSTFFRNSGSEGGSLSLSNSTVRTFSSSFKEEKASVSGGAISVNAQSSVTGMNTSFSNCSSGSGGAVSISQSHVEGVEFQIHACSADTSGGGVFANDSSTFTCSKCSFDDNKANRYGGAVAFNSTKTQRLAMQLDNCSFVNNLADLGGALHVSGRRESENCSRLDPSCTRVVLTDITFSLNKAKTSGGAVFVEDPDILRYSCPAQEVETLPLWFDSNDSQILTPLTSVRGFCHEWGQNQAGGYGPIVGSYARTVRVHTPGDDSRTNRKWEQTSQLLLNGQKSGDPLPSIEVEILDSFGQGPPLGRGDEHIVATIRSPNESFFGEVKKVLSEPQNELPVIYSLQRPGHYTVTVDFSEPRLSQIVIDIEFRSCIIGECVQESGKLCVPCSGTQYNFDSNASACTPCPVNGNCTSNAIFPNRGHWHRTPCSHEIQECISKEACDFPERDMELFTIQQDMRNCHFNKTLDRIYAEALCKKGYKGTLCGSCDVGYGHSRGLHCSKCHNDPEMISLLVATLVVLLLLSSFTVASNLNTLSPECSRANKSSNERSFHSRLRSLRRESATEVPVNFQMVEMLSTGHVPPELINPDLFLTTISIAEKKNDSTESKANVVEIFKIAINFLQVIGAAVFINANWTTWMRSVLSAADFFSGAAMDGMMLSADCLFASDHQPPRSILRTIIFLVVPAAALVLYFVFWAIWTYRSKQSIAYFAKALMLSTLAVVYLTYISITKTAVDTVHCIGVHDSIDVEDDHVSRYWAMDTSLKCYEGSHAILASTAGWPIIFLFTFGIPLALAYALLRIENRCPEQDSNGLFAEASGFLYRAYKERFFWWESVVMFRKAALTIVVAFSYPLGTNLQGVIAVCLLTFATYFHVLCRPFRDEDDYLNGYETASLFVSVLTFASGLFFNDERTSDVVRVLLTIFLSVAIGGLLCLFAYTLLACVMTHVKAALVDEGIEEAHHWGICRCVKVYASMIISAFFARLSKYFHPAPDDYRSN